MPTTYWAPNQSAVAQVETYTYTAPSGVGNTYTATINGKTVTYQVASGDTLTAAAAATAHYALLSASSSVPPEFSEITFSNPSDGVVVATASTPGTPFANVTVNGVSGQGLVMSTGNGLANGIATVHTTANRSPSDVNDAQNWLRVVTPAPPVRSLPQNLDDVVVANTSVPLLWNLDRLSTTQFNTYTRWQNFEGTIGLPDNNPNGYTEWRATYFRFIGPAGSLPAGGLQMVLGFDSGSGSGPGRERYNLGSQQFTLTALAAGSPQDDYGIKVLGVHTQNVFKISGGVSLGVALLPSETAQFASCTVADATFAAGVGLTWTAGSTLSVYGGTVLLNSAPATLSLANGASATITTDSLTWATISAQGASALTFSAGGIITTLTLSTGSTLDKSGDARGLTITNSTIDGDTCTIDDPLNAITWTNATIVKQQVSSGPFKFTGSRTVKVT